MFFAIWFCWHTLHEIYGDIFAAKLSKNFPHNWIPEGWSLEGWMADDVSNLFLKEMTCLWKQEVDSVLSGSDPVKHWDKTKILKKKRRRKNFRLSYKIKIAY